jgi:hypothetical protein
VERDPLSFHAVFLPSPPNIVILYHQTFSSSSPKHCHPGAKRRICCCPCRCSCQFSPINNPSQNRHPERSSSQLHRELRSRRTPRDLISPKPLIAFSHHRPSRYLCAQSTFSIYLHHQTIYLRHQTLSSWSEAKDLLLPCPCRCLFYAVAVVVLRRHPNPEHSRRGRTPVFRLCHSF